MAFLTRRRFHADFGRTTDKGETFELGSFLELTPFGRQEEWEDPPEGWPQTPPYVWWRKHDEYERG